MEVEKKLVFETHICNCCGNKTTVFSLTSEDGSFFNLCPSCGVNILSKEFFSKMSLAQISDILRKQ